MHSFPPSFLDRLLGADAPGGDGSRRRQSVEQVKASVARDVEMLLNTHRAWPGDALAAFPAAARSSLTLGLVDIASMSLASDGDRRRIVEAIRDTLAAHDRRLGEVEVGVRTIGGSAGCVAFTIRAKLRLAPGVERVVFDAVLQPGSNRYEVSNAVVGRRA